MNVAERLFLFRISLSAVVDVFVPCFLFYTLFEGKLTEEEEVALGLRLQGNRISLLTSKREQFLPSLHSA